MKKTITRRVIIRIDQFVKLRNRAIKYDELLGDSPYDRAWCEPLTMKEIDQYWTMSLLKNPNLGHCDPIKYFFIHHRLYESAYTKDLSRIPYTADGQIWVWPARCKDEKQLVWGVFEKDLP